MRRSFWAPLWAIGLLVLPGAVRAYSQELPITVGLEQLSVESTSPDVRIRVWEEAGHSWAEVSYTGAAPMSVTLAEVPLGAVDNCTLQYRAAVRGPSESPVYLEMWCVFPDGGRYFSRALNQAVSEQVDFFDSETPFLLQPGESPTKVQLGVRFEGPGAVTLRNLALHKHPLLNFFLNRPAITLRNLGLYKEPLVDWGRYGTSFGIAGALVGIWTALWALTALLLAWKGRAKPFVMAVTALCLAAGVLLLLDSAVLLVQGAEFWLWYLPALIGAITLPNFGFLLGMLWWLYRRAENRRVAAMDLGPAQ